MKEIFLFLLLALVPQFASATTIYLTSGSSWTMPSDWNSSNNTVECIGGGGNGGTSSFYVTETGSGGGGGAYAKSVNLVLSGTVSYHVGGVSGDTWFGGSSFPSSGQACGAKGGSGGSAPSGGAGGSAAASYSTGTGSVKNSGGAGGSGTNAGGQAGGGAGGGGAAGSSGGVGGPGGAGVVIGLSQGPDYSDGGSGGSSPGGGAGASGPACPAFYEIAGGSGGNGSQYTTSYGTGGGGSGACNFAPQDGNGNQPGGNGGAYGAGGGGGTYDFTVPADASGGSGAPGLIVITYTPAPPTCTITFDGNPIYQPNSTTLRYSSSNVPNGDTFYINSVGSVGSSGSVSVSPGASTDYSGSIKDGSNNVVATCTPNPAILTVYRDCTFNSSTIQSGQSVSAYQSATVPYGNSCVSQQRTCTDSSLSGSYAYASCSVNPPASCTQDGTTVSSGSSYTFYSTRTAPSGQLCSSYSLSRSCTNGTLSGNSSYQYSSCGCVAQTAWSCNDSQTIASTTITAACGQSTTNTSCVAPAYCSAGIKTCQYPAPSYTSFTSDQGDSYTGHLTAHPSLVPESKATSLFWDVGNVSSCTVSGNDGETWTGVSAGCNGTSCSSGTGGKTTNPILQQTVFTFACTGLDGSSLNESQTVTVVPAFQER